MTAPQLPSRSVARYGWRRDLPDPRDLHFAAAPEIVADLPDTVDLRDRMPTVYDQGQLGSCMANALAGAFQFDQTIQELPSWVPSRLFIYWNERSIEGDTDQDGGAQIRDGVKALNKVGVCPETEWPYVVDRFAEKPTVQAFAYAKDHLVTEYRRVARDIDQMRGCLAAGFPFVLGFTVFDSFESKQVAKSGVLELPSPDESVLGGHAVCAVGYDHAAGRFIVRNSWGESWGQHGYFTMPYDYLLRSDLSADFWTLRTVS